MQAIIKPLFSRLSKLSKRETEVKSQSIHINIFGGYEGPTPGNDDEAQRIYLASVSYRCGSVPLSGLDRTANNAESPYRAFGLDRLYIELDTETLVSDVALKQALQTNQPLTMYLQEGGRPEDLRPLAALEAAALERRMVLLGEPGSGKTTFANRLCLALAREDWTRLENWPKTMRNRLPMLIVLRDFVYWLDDQAGSPEPSPKLLDDYLRYDLHRHNLGFAEKVIKRAFDEGQALVVLDGLDEVPPRRRETVLETVDAFAENYEQAKILVTCRIASYESSQWQLPKQHFAEFKLAAFNETKISAFIDGWYEEIAERRRDKPRTLEQAVKLKYAVRRRDLARLAPNPLLLTVMALVHTEDKYLPEHRALLYQRAVDILLWRWEDQRDIPGERLRDRLRDIDANSTDLLRLLRKLAFRLHAENTNSRDPEAVTSIRDSLLWKAFRLLHPDHDIEWAKGLVDYMKHRTGLLIEREPGIFTFPHRTFQEYLAGLHLAIEPNFSRNAVKLTEKSEIWNEVILLAVGNRVHEVGEHDQPLLLVNNLCPPDRIPSDDVGWRKVRLASDALLEIGPNRVKRHPEGERLMQRVQSLLASLVESDRLSLKERLLTAETLGRLGDSRFDQKTFYLPCRYHGKAEPNWGFIRIPAGPLVMGSKRGDPQAREDELGNKNPLSFPYEFWISRYPVTVMQFEAFVDDGGYEKADLWRGDGARSWFRNRQRAIPIAWHRQRLYPNRPVTHISWFEANAYSNWLHMRLKERRFPLLIDEHRVRLPTEAEWEKAARDNGQAIYPWGDEEWTSWRANINRSGIGDITPVGIYSAGTTRKGLHDMAGNVWEWTQSCYRKYPYRAEVNDLRSTEPRTVRGGSWANEVRTARCASRLGLPPESENSFLGFRVIIARAEGVF